MLDVEGNSNDWGENVTAQVGQIVPGQRYTIAVTGATQDAFAVGAYQLSVSFAGDPSVVAIPPVPSPEIAGGSSPPATISQATPVAPVSGDPDGAQGQTMALGTITSTAVGARSLGTGNVVDRFTFKAARVGLYQVSAPGTLIRVLGGSGNLIVAGNGLVALRSRRPRTSFLIQIRPASGTSVAIYSLSIHRQVAPGPAALRIHHG